MRRGGGGGAALFTAGPIETNGEEETDEKDAFFSELDVAMTGIKLGTVAPSKAKDALTVFKEVSSSIWALANVANGFINDASLVSVEGDLVTIPEASYESVVELVEYIGIHVSADGGVVG